MVRVGISTRRVGLEYIHHLVTNLRQYPDQRFCVFDATLRIKADALAIHTLQGRHRCNHGYMVGMNGFERDTFHALWQVAGRGKQAIGDVLGAQA